MASTFDESDFIDSDYQSASAPAPTAATQTAAPVVASQKPPTREELESKVSQTQQRLLELKRAQEELERERAGLEEARRRRLELQTGREEIVQNLTRGVGLLEEAEFAARREAEQMSKSLADLRDALGKVLPGDFEC
jgi:DNA repair exonuclease SbcCD ATPase subunit